VIFADLHSPIVLAFPARYRESSSWSQAEETTA
jgi:hypothetical protein